MSVGLFQAPDAIRKMADLLEDQNEYGLIELVSDASNSWGAAGEGRRLLLGVCRIIDKSPAGNSRLSEAQNAHFDKIKACYLRAVAKKLEPGAADKEPDIHQPVTRALKDLSNLGNHPLELVPQDVFNQYVFEFLNINEGYLLSCTSKAMRAHFLAYLPKVKATWNALQWSLTHSENLAQKFPRLRMVVSLERGGVILSDNIVNMVASSCPKIESIAGQYLYQDWLTSKKFNA